jgi:hypothetical protein
MTPEQMAHVRGFATGLATLKAKEELKQGAELTAEEVAGIIWAIKQLRAGAKP